MSSIDVPQGQATPPLGFFNALAAYLSDGVRVVATPVTTIAEAAARELTLGVAVAIFAVLFLIDALLSSFVMFGLAAMGAISPGVVLAVVGQDFAYALAAGVMILAVAYSLITILGGQGTLRRFLSGALVVKMFLVLCSAVALIALMGMISVGFMFLAPIATYLPILAAIIAIAYGVLAVRFGGLVDYARAFVITFLSMAIWVGLALLLNDNPPMSIFGLSDLGQETLHG